MYITIDENDRRPIYQQIVDEIKAIIAAGELPEGSALPPVRQVAADLGVNLNTVAFAYRKLQAAGLIKVKHGSGAVVLTQVTPKSDEEQLQSKLLPVLTDMVLAGMTKSEVLAMVSTSLKRLAGSRSEIPKTTGR